MTADRYRDALYNLTVVTRDYSLAKAAGTHYDGKTDASTHALHAAAIAYALEAHHTESKYADPDAAAAYAALAMKWLVTALARAGSAPNHHREYLDRTIAERRALTHLPPITQRLLDMTDATLAELAATTTTTPSDEPTATKSASRRRAKDA